MYSAVAFKTNMTKLVLFAISIKDQLKSVFNFLVETISQQRDSYNDRERYFLMGKERNDTQGSAEHRPCIDVWLVDLESKGSSPILRLEGY